jgi:hypothetical protein
LAGTIEGTIKYSHEEKKVWLVEADGKTTLLARDMTEHGHPDGQQIAAGLMGAYDSYWVLNRVPEGATTKLMASRVSWGDRPVVLVKKVLDPMLV